MSLDLTLLIPEYPFGTNLAMAFTDLHCERRAALFDEVIGLEAQSGQLAPPDLLSHYGRVGKEEPRWRATPSSPDGERLRWVSAGALSALVSHAGVQDQHRNRAAWAYLAALPVDWPVVLYWH